MKIKPFKNAGRFTTFENDIIDYIMPLCKPNTWKIVCATIRKTTGWHKEEDWISVTQFMKMTGIKGRGTCHNAIIDATGSEFLVRKKFRNSFKYALNKHYEIGNVPKIGTSIVTEIGTPNVPKIGNTKETTTKEIKEQKIKDIYINSFVFVLADVMGMDAKINFGKIKRWATVLDGAGYAPLQVSDIYSPGGLWYTDDWRGKKGDMPTIGHINDTIKRLSSVPDKEEDRQKYVTGEFSDMIEH